MNNAHKEILKYFLGGKKLSDAIRYIWILGGVFFSLLIMITYLLYVFLIADSSFSPDRLRFYVDVGLSLYHMPATVIVWRCADNALKLHWKYLSRLYVLLNLIFIISFYIEIIKSWESGMFYGVSLY